MIQLQVRSYADLATELGLGPTYNYFETYIIRITVVSSNQLQEN